MQLPLKFIYSFHMAAFMLISGFVGFRKPMSWHVCQKKFFRLIVPFFAWWLLSAVARAAMSGDAVTILTSFIALVKDPAAGLWFFWVLGVLVLWLYGIQRIARWLHLKEYLVALTSWIVLLGVSRMGASWLCFKAMVHYFVFFYLGYVLYHTNDDFLDRKLFRWTTFAALLAGHVLCFSIASCGMPFKGVISLMASLFGALSVLALFKCFKYRIDSVDSIGCLVGRQTFGIYAIHWYLIPFIAMVPNFTWGGVCGSRCPGSLFIVCGNYNFKVAPSKIYTFGHHIKVVACSFSSFSY